MNKLEKLHELGQKLLAVENEEDVSKVGIEVEAEIHDLIKGELYQFIEFNVDRVMDRATGEFLHFQAASKPEMIDILGGSIVIAAMNLKKVRHGLNGLSMATGMLSGRRKG